MYHIRFQLKHALLAGCLVIITLIGITHPTAAADPISGLCAVDGTNSELCKDRSDKLFGPGSLWNNIINTLIFIVGAASVVMIIIGGLRYTLSGGDASGTKSARETIIYAVIGMVISIMAYAMVNFVLSRL